jgi:hypothetical protein
MTVQVAHFSERRNPSPRGDRASEVDTGRRLAIGKRFYEMRIASSSRATRQPRVDLMRKTFAARLDGLSGGVRAGSQCSRAEGFLATF